MSWVTIIMDQDDKKVKIDWFYLNKIILCTIRGDQFLYIYPLNLVTSLVFVPTVFFSQFSNPPCSGSSFYFILSFFLSSSPSTCRLDCWC